MSLIDADALIEALRESRDAHANTAREYSLLCRCINIVQEQPIACDVDKIVEQLMNKHCGKCRNFITKGLLDKDYCRHQKCDIHDICEIVKTGGSQCGAKMKEQI